MTGEQLKLEVLDPAKEEYIPFFRMAESVLKELLPKLSDGQIAGLVSNENWVAFPVSEEESKDEMENRLEPHIDLSLTNTTVRVGIRCNPVDSVDKLQNILEDYHTPERNELVVAMNSVDSDFQTVVYAKLKHHYWAEKGEHEERFRRQTNQLEDAGIREMLEKSGEIRRDGKTRMRDEKLSVNPSTPVIEIAFTIIDRKDGELFKRKLSQLKPIYETCLKVKTDSFLRAVKRKREGKKSEVSSRTNVFSCPKCGKQFSKEEFKIRRFCDVDDMKIRASFAYD